MSDKAQVGNPTPATYGGVEVDHPTIKKYVEQGQKQGMTKEQVMKIVGQPMEVIDKNWKR